MDGKIGWRLLAALVLLVAVAGIGYMAFNAGIAQGVATKLPTTAPAAGTVPYPYYGMPFGWHAFPFFGFGCFGPLLALLLLFLAFRALSFVFWGPRWGHMHHMRHEWRHAWENGEVPPMVREVHDRLHNTPGSEKKNE